MRGVRGIFSKARITVEASKASTFNRWKLIVPAVSTHLCLGAPFAWSLLNGPLTRELGGVVSSAADWTLGPIVATFSTALAMQGISAALGGKWCERVGPRVAGLVSAGCFSGGFLVGGLGVYMHSLPLLIGGYGLLGGIGIGLGYVPPLAMLIKWFPDRKGLATGLTVMGFGGGALFAAPVMDRLMHHFSQAPRYLGSSDQLSPALRDGKLYVDGVAFLGEQAPSASQMLVDNVEVVRATAAEIAKSGVFSELQEGIYQVGTGNTGVALTLTALGAAYGSVMLLSALSYRLPPDGFSPEGWTPPKTDGNVSSTSFVHVDNIHKTRQFWTMFFTFGCTSTAGLALASVAKDMMSDVWAPLAPAVVTAGFASTYVASLSAANLLGRVGWSALSDRIGRRNAFLIYTGATAPLFLALPIAINAGVASPGSVLPLSVFYGATLLAFSTFGAGYSTMPAYESDMFGSRHAGAIHGRMLLASSVAAVAGPLGIAWERSRAEREAIESLVQRHFTEGAFQEHFGAPLAELPQLIGSKAVSIDKLMALLPQGTVDPTAFLYNNTLYAGCGILAVAALAISTLRPVAIEHFKMDKWLVVVDGSDTSHASFERALKSADPDKHLISVLLKKGPGSTKKSVEDAVRDLAHVSYTEDDDHTKYDKHEH